MATFLAVVHFFAYVPKLHPRLFSVAGLDFSDKSFTYLLALQLMFNNGKESFASSLVGMIWGFLYFSEALMLHHFVLPNFIVSSCSKCSSLIFGSEQASDEQNMASAAAANGGRGMPMGTRNQSAAPNTPAQPPVNEGALEMLQGMGFSRERSEAALRETGNNAEAENFY